MAELGMPLGHGAEPGWPDYGNGKRVLTMRVKRRAGVVVIRPTPNIALPTAGGCPPTWINSSAATGRLDPCPPGRSFRAESAIVMPYPATLFHTGGAGRADLVKALRILAAVAVGLAESSKAVMAAACGAAAEVP